MSTYEWDDNEHPLAYLITIRTFGTWLHGDERGSVDRHGKNIYGASRIEPVKKLSTMMSENAGVSGFLLNGKQRSVVEQAIRDVCDIRGYGLSALNVRTNHVHSVNSACVKPESLINAIKSNTTRELRQHSLIDNSIKIWSRGGSRRYLWKEQNVEAAIDYVLYGQGDELPNF